MVPLTKNLHSISSAFANSTDSDILLIAFLLQVIHQVLNHTVKVLRKS